MFSGYATKVDSTSIESLFYDPGSSSLCAKFRGSGHCYQYQGVRAALAHSLREADSVGSYFNQHIKSDHQSDKIDALAYEASYRRIAALMTPPRVFNIDWIKVAGNGHLPSFPR